MGSNEIKISVVIPVYNREKLIQRCLESVINQTLKDVEIIVVDDGSDDNSFKVCKEYEERCADRIRLYKNLGKGAASARNYGISKAGGEFITFLDSDDYIKYDAFECMYGYAKMHNAQIVCAPLYFVDEYKCQVVVGRHDIEFGNIKDFINKATPNLYNKIFSRRLIEKINLEIPEFILGEDTAYVTTLLSWAERVGYVDYPYYYYELSENSLSNTIDRPWILENVKQVEKWIMEHINPEYKDMAPLVLARRYIHIYNTNVDYQDILQEYAAEKKYLYLYGIPEQFKTEIKKIKDVVLMQDEKIPDTIILNGFAHELTQEEITNWEKKTFRDNAKVVVLDEKKCNLSENENVRKAYQQKDFQYLVHYFATKYIYEHGGIYISLDLDIVAKLNCLKNRRAFFGYKNNYSFTDKIYGGIKGCDIFRELNDELENTCYRENAFADILYYYLTDKLHLQFRNSTEKNVEDNIWIYASSMFIFPRCGEINVTRQRFFYEGKFYVPEDIFLEYIQEDTERKKTLDAMRKEIKKDIERKKTLESLQKEILELKNQYVCIENSLSFKTGRIITYIPRKIRAFIVCVKNRGVFYTVKYSLEKLVGKNYVR